MDWSGAVAIGAFAVLLIVLVVSVVAAPPSSPSAGFDVSEFDETKISRVHWRHRQWLKKWLKANPTKAGVAGVWRFPPYGRFTSVGAAQVPSLMVAAGGNWFSSRRLKVENRGRFFVRPSFVEVTPDGEYLVTFSGSGETPLSLDLRLESGQVLVIFNHPRQKWRFGQRQQHRLSVGLFLGDFDEAARVRGYLDIG